MGSKGGEINNAEVIFLVGNFSGYCGYCYNGVKDYDETGIDCGGPNCPQCEVEVREWNFRSWAIIVLGLFLILLVLLYFTYNFSDISRGLRDNIFKKIEELKERGSE